MEIEDHLLLLLSGLFAIHSPLRGNFDGQSFFCYHTKRRRPSSRPGSLTATSALNTAPTSLAARFPWANSSSSSPFLGRMIRPPTRQNGAAYSKSAESDATARAVTTLNAPRYC